MARTRNENARGVVLEPTLDRVIVALCGDYTRRSKCKDDPENGDFLADLNAAIDGAIAAEMPSYDERAREAMREDIGTRRGATYTPLYDMSPATYKRLKRRIKARIALALGYA